MVSNCNRMVASDGVCKRHGGDSTLKSTLQKKNDISSSPLNVTSPHSFIYPDLGINSRLELALQNSNSNVNRNKNTTTNYDMSSPIRAALLRAASEMPQIPSRAKRQYSKSTDDLLNELLNTQTVNTTNHSQPKTTNQVDSRRNDHIPYDFDEYLFLEEK